MILPKKFTYIDLFAGIGGFHCAMDLISDKQAKCLMASEIDPKASKIYQKNFDIAPLGDVRNVDPKKIELPPFDVVCGGFPCQTFSKAGKQNGFKDPRGTLFYEIIRIVKSYEHSQRPKILVLENVRNLIHHDKGATWQTIRHEIKEAGYCVVDEPLVISPLDVGIPQLRDRALIFAVRNDIYNGPLNVHIKRAAHGSGKILKGKWISKNLTPEENKRYSLTKEQTRVLDCWDDFIKGIGPQTIGFPIWSQYFGTDNDISFFPEWKQEFVNKSRILYKNNKVIIDKWLKKWNVRNSLTPTNQKFEWQMGTDYSSVYDGIIQFRTSGVRVKRPTESPALVAMVHRPIIGPYKRFITPRETARLQSFPENYDFDERDFDIYKQLGNAVNVKVIADGTRQFIDFVENALTKGGAKNEN